MSNDEDFKWINGLTFNEGMNLREAQRFARQERKKLGEISESPESSKNYPAQHNLKELRASLEATVQLRMTEKLAAKTNVQKELVADLTTKSQVAETVQKADEPESIEDLAPDSEKPLGKQEVKQSPKVAQAAKKNNRPEIVKASPLNSPKYGEMRACPRCKQKDQIQKYSGIVSSQSSTAKGTAVTDRGMFRSNYVTSSTTRSQSDLATREKKPSKPFSPTTTFVLGLVGCAIFFSALPALIISLVVTAIGAYGTFTYSGRRDYQKSLQAYFDKTARYENNWYCSRCDFIYA